MDRINLNNPVTALQMYILILLIEGAGVGYLIKSQIDSLSQKEALYNTAKSEVSTLQENKFSLVDQDIDLKRYADLISSLSKAIPDEPEVDQYLIDLVLASSEEGFSINSFSPVIREETNSIDVIASFNGDPGLAYKLTNRISQMSRRGVIKNVTLTFDTPKRVEINYQIFFHKKGLDSVVLDDAKIDIDFIKKEFKPANERN